MSLAPLTKPAGAPPPGHDDSWDTMGASTCHVGKRRSSVLAGTPGSERESVSSRGRVVARALGVWWRAATRPYLPECPRCRRSRDGRARPARRATRRCDARVKGAPLRQRCGGSRRARACVARDPPEKARLRVARPACDGLAPRAPSGVRYGRSTWRGVRPRESSRGLHERRGNVLERVLGVAGIPRHVTTQREHRGAEVQKNSVERGTPRLGRTSGPFDEARFERWVEDGLASAHGEGVSPSSASSRRTRGRSRRCRRNQPAPTIAAVTPKPSVG
jgi:hypothetical protein